MTRVDSKQIEKLIEEHKTAPHLRILQKNIAREITTMVHSAEAYQAAVAASEILFGKGTQEELAQLDEQTFRDIFEGVPTFELDAQLIAQGVNLTELLSVHTAIFPSKGECRKMVKAGGLSINQTREDDSEATVGSQSLIKEKYILVRKGKKNYNLITLR